MAHELDTTAAGSAAFVSRKLTAWHRLGTVLTDADMDALSLPELLELAGVGFDVVKAPNVSRVPCPTCDGEGEVISAYSSDVLLCPAGCDNGVVEIACGSQSYSIVRTDRMEVIGSVGENYAPLQNVEAFGVLEPLLDSGIVQVETAGSLRGGKQVWTLVSFQVDEILRRVHESGAGQDVVVTAESVASEVLPYALFTNDHTGRARARIKETAIRVVCANTMAMSFGESVGTDVEVTHAGDVTANYQAAAGLLLQSIASRYAGFAEKAVELRSRKLSRVEFKENVLDVAAPIAHLEAKLREGANADRTK